MSEAMPEPAGDASFREHPGACPPEPAAGAAAGPEARRPEPTQEPSPTPDPATAPPAAAAPRAPAALEPAIGIVPDAPVWCRALGPTRWRVASDDLDRLRRLVAAGAEFVLVTRWSAGTGAWLTVTPATAPPAAAAAPAVGSTPRRRRRPLTGREIEVLRLIADGLHAKEIARRLGISLRTVDVHRAHIKQKLRVQTIGDLVRAGIRQGLVSP